MLQELLGIVCPSLGDKVTPPRAHSTADPISPLVKNFFPAAPPHSREPGPGWSRLVPFPSSAPADLGASKCKSCICLETATLQVASSCIHILELQRVEGGDSKTADQNNSGRCLLCSVDVPGREGRESTGTAGGKGRKEIKSKEKCVFFLKDLPDGGNAKTLDSLMQSFPYLPWNEQLFFFQFHVGLV